MAPEVSVVAATHNRAGRLEELLDGLRRQTVGAERFEVVVVDDASSDGTPSVLAAAQDRGDLHLTALRREISGGPGTARNTGWRAARGNVVAFTDDDCVPAADWLERLLAAGAQDAVVQGRTAPNPDEADALGPFATWREVPAASPYFQTCNISYPRALLEQLDGFDERFSHAGEDADLGHRAVKAGARVVFAPDALVHHAVDHIGPREQLRRAARATDGVQIYGLHPELAALKVNGLFYKSSHRYALPAALGLLLARRWPAAALLALPYLLHLRGRKDLVHGGWDSLPFLVLYDAVEVAAVLRGAVRHRTLVL